MPMREKIFLAWVRFRAVREIRSLPPYHGERWSAWFRFACRHAGLEAETVFLGLYPLRNGQDPILKGEELTVRLVLDLDGCKTLPALLASLAEMEARGEFSGSSLQPCSYMVMAMDEAARADQAEMAMLTSCDWPGNFRQLRHVLTMACIADKTRASDCISVSDIRKHLGNAPVTRKTGSLETASPADLEKWLDEQKKACIIKVLAETDNNVAKTAKRLGYTYQKLDYYLKKSGIRI